MATQSHLIETRLKSATSELAKLQVKLKIRPTRRSPASLCHVATQTDQSTSATAATQTDLVVLDEDLERDTMLHFEDDFSDEDSLDPAQSHSHQNEYSSDEEDSVFDEDSTVRPDNTIDTAALARNVNEILRERELTRIKLAKEVLHIKPRYMTTMLSKPTVWRRCGRRKRSLYLKLKEWTESPEAIEALVRMKRENGWRYFSHNRKELAELPAEPLDTKDVALR